MTFCKWLTFFAGLACACASPVSADKIIMKDGKIYEGRIMGETARVMLIRPAKADAKPLFLNLTDVQTVVRESHGAETISAEAGRFAQVDVLVTGSSFYSRKLGMGWAPGLTLNGGFRLHPALELGAGIDFWPGLAGDVTVEDIQSQTLRRYESFYAYGGGFHVKVFPFYRRAWGRWEPFVFGGYHWNRLTPKGSGDYFSGTSWLGGVGASWRLTRALSLEGRALFQRTSFDKIKFQTGEGDISGVRQTGISLGAGIAYRFL